MLRTIFFLLILMITLSGCKKRPDNILSEKKMVQIMADMQMAEAYMNVKYKGQMAVKQRDSIGNSVLAKYGVEREVLDSTLSWYGRNYDDYLELYKKVDKVILDRKKKLTKISGAGQNVEGMDGDNLWTLYNHSVAMKNSDTNGWIFSISQPNLQKGDILEWSLHIPFQTSFTGSLGVDYTDGSIDVYSSQLNSRDKITLSLQTDTAKEVRRIFGTLMSPNRLRTDIYADSIKLIRLPFDSTEYKKKPGQRKYGALKSIKPKVAVKDTVATIVKDSVVSTDNNFSSKPVSIEETSTHLNRGVRGTTTPAAGPSNRQKL